MPRTRSKATIKCAKCSCIITNQEYGCRCLKCNNTFHATCQHIRNRQFKIRIGEGATANGYLLIDCKECQALPNRKARRSYDRSSLESTPLLPLAQRIALNTAPSTDHTSLDSTPPLTQNIEPLTRPLPQAMRMAMECIYGDPLTGK
jgi:hypothetical protein